MTQIKKIEEAYQLKKRYFKPGNKTEYVAVITMKISETPGGRKRASFMTENGDNEFIFQDSNIEKAEAVANLIEYACQQVDAKPWTEEGKI